MGRRGPKPEPAAIKIAKGNPSRRPVGEDPAPMFGAAKVTPPAWLKKGGLAVWKRLAPRVTALKLLTQTDAETFARYCRNFARWLEANAAIDKDGMSYATDTGYERIRVAMMVSIRLEPLLERAEDRFGLNPAERQRIFAARSAMPAGDLFGGQAQPARPSGTGQPDPARRPGAGEPVGFLN